jgi:hypothetical protein
MLVGMKLAGGTRHRDETLQMFTCFLKQPCSENDFGQ